MIFLSPSTKQCEPSSPDNLSNLQKDFGTLEKRSKLLHSGMCLHLGENFKLFPLSTWH